MKRSTKTESVLETFARAVGASAGIAVHTGSDVADEIMQAAKRIRQKIAQGADRVKKASVGAQVGGKAARKPAAPARKRASRTRS
jgi:hypothetical protein